MRPTEPNAKLIIEKEIKITDPAEFNWLIISSMDDIFSI
jgi:hypothetical protein